MSNPFLDRQAQIRARLLESTTLKDGDAVIVPVLTEDPKDPLAAAYLQIYKGALVANTAGKSGIAVVIQTLTGVRPGDARGKLIAPVLTQRIWIRELVAANRDAKSGIGVSAWDVLWAVLTQLQGWAPGPGLQLMAFDAFATEQDPATANLDLFCDFTWSPVLTAS